MKRCVPTGLLCLIFVACGDATTGPRGSVSFDWQGSVAPGDHVEIKGISGTIRAIPSTTRDVAVSATKSARESDPATVAIEVVEHSGGVTICALYPDVSGAPPNECVPGEGGNMSNRDNDVRVDFEVRLPPGIDFVGRTISGNVDVEGIGGEADARVVSGNVTIDAMQHAEATVVSGNITVTMGMMTLGRDTEFSTTSGNVMVSVHMGCNAEVVLSAVSGTISSDFALTRVNPGLMTGTLGAGGSALRLASISGNVSLRRF